MKFYDWLGSIRADLSIVKKSNYCLIISILETHSSEILRYDENKFARVYAIDLASAIYFFLKELRGKKASFGDNETFKIPENLEIPYLYDVF